MTIQSDEAPPCALCGRPMMKEGEGWACQDPECDGHGYVKKVEERPTGRPGRYCVHGFTPIGQWCRGCNPLRR